MNISASALSENKTWTSLGSVAQGGTVYSVAISPVADVTRCWAATGCGIFFTDNNGKTWIQSLSGLTTPLLGALAISKGGALIAGSLQGDFFTSFDYGESWSVGIVPPESKGTITSLAISPNFHSDGCAFAATDGAGLLVSRTSGHIWEDSSFGLGSNSVLAVVTAPDWSRRELMFTATIDGVFISTNGGRAWRETELLMSDDVVDTLAISPAFEKDHTVFAGTENGSFYRSTDSGRTWDCTSNSIGDGPVNCLWVDTNYADSHKVFAGVNSAIFCSEDSGESWKQVANNHGTVLALAGSADIVIAGLQDEGITSSVDGGATWQSSTETLAARGFSELTSQPGALFVMGPQEGVFASSDGGNSWSSLPGLEAFAPVTTMLARNAQELLVASQTSGILSSQDGGMTWKVVCDAEGIQVLALANDGTGLAGSVDGSLYLTKDGGATWSETTSPSAGQEVLAITFSPLFSEDHTILLGTAIAATTSQQARVALWRTTNAGANWRQVTTQVTSARWLDVTLPIGVGARAIEQAIMVTGPFCLRPLRRAKDVWISTRVDPSGTNALSVVLIGEIDSGGMLYVATGNGVFRSIDGGRTWHAFLQPEEAQSFISLTVADEDSQRVLYALSLGGRIYRHVIA